MSRPQKLYRGVRQRQWGSWVSEIRPPSARPRIWLGSFKTAEEAARAYDEAARLMFGPTAETNFPFDPNSPQPALLSAALRAKLHQIYLTNQKSDLQEPRINPSTPTPIFIPGNCVAFLDPETGDTTCVMGPFLMGCSPVWIDLQSPAQENPTFSPQSGDNNTSADDVDELVKFVATMVRDIPPLPPLP